MRDKQVKPLLAQHLDPIVECLGPVLSLERLMDEVGLATWTDTISPPLTLPTPDAATFARGPVFPL